MPTPDAFFLPDGTDSDAHAYVATDRTRGPWDPGSQHGGPPAALLAHAMAERHPRDDVRLARVTVEIERPVPVGRLLVRTEVLRPGRRVELLGAELADEAGRRILTARAWRIRHADLSLPAPFAERPIPPLEAAEAKGSFFTEIDWDGYVQAMEVRFAEGGWDAPGPAIAWMRQRVPLVAGTETRPVERVLVCADSGNGLSASFRGLFINPELTVHLHRHPEGEWIGLDAATVLTGDGIGLATSVLHDAAGPIGRGAQSLLLDVPEG